jgi:epoxyqueuosine reductase
MTIYPNWIAPLFNKYTELEDGTLKTKINNLAGKLNFPLTKIYVVDGSKCISYFTIELKEQIPNEMKGKWNDWMFGCDVCMDVCPWNSFSKPNQEPQFVLNELIKENKLTDWIELSEDLFKQYFKKSAIKRTKFSGLKRNIQFLTQHHEKN